MSETLTEHDLRALLGVVEEGRRDAPTEGLPWATLDELARLVRCDCVAFPEADLVAERGLLNQWLDADGRGLELDDADDPEPEFWAANRVFLPCTYAERTGDFTTVVRWSDFYSSAELREQPAYADFFFAHDGTTHALHASLPALPGHFRKITFWRAGGPDFTERDRLVVQLLRPHIWELFLDSQRRLGRVPKLTAREWEVLRLAGQGYGNRDIARELFVSVSTVRKHLEHIFDRTGTRTRGAAAALMMPHQPAVALPRRT